MNRFALKSLALLASLLLSQAQAQWVDYGNFGSYSGTYRGNASGGQGAISSESTSRPDPHTHAWAASSLIGGKLHAVASATPRTCSSIGCKTVTDTAAGAYFWDTITFTNSVKAGWANLHLSIDGTLTPRGAQAAVHWFAGNKPSDFWRDPAKYTERTVLTSGTTLIGDDLLVPLGAGTYFIYAQLYVTADAASYPNISWSGLADFGNTLHFNWILPEGVTYSSASGHFMTAVPEPGSLVMMAFGLVGLAAVRMRQLSPATAA